MDSTLPPTPVDFNLNKRPRTVTHSIECSTKVELNNIRLNPCIKGLLKVMRYGEQCVSAAQTFPMSKLSIREKTYFSHKLEKL